MFSRMPQPNPVCSRQPRCTAPGISRSAIWHSWRRSPRATGVKRSMRAHGWSMRSSTDLPVWKLQRFDDGSQGGSIALSRRIRAVHTDLRVSLTDRCSLRCTYCMPAGAAVVAGASMLSTRNYCGSSGRGVVRSLQRAADRRRTVAASDVVDIVSGIANLGVEVSMTTNGLRLPGLAAPLRDAGLHRVNVSLDTFGP